jgi:Ca2+-binding RTX toxin-like protein
VARRRSKDVSRRVTLPMASAGMGVVMLVFAGGALAAVITCTGGRCCEGTNDPDQITGSELSDDIFALAGDDDVFASAGEDTLYGRAGEDLLLGENDNDTYFGGRGDDRLSEFGGDPR